MLGRVLGSARVQLHTAGLSDDDVRRALLDPVADVTSAVAVAVDDARRAGGNGRVCVLPQGPLTVATAVE